MKGNKKSHLRMIAAFVAGVLLHTGNACGQEAGMPKIIPPSPGAISSLAAVNSSNSLYTGKLSTFIPIWDITTRNFRVPVSLNYTGGNGIKLEEVSSWIGLGWGLIGDFNISRTVNGFHDDKLHGYLAMDSRPALVQENAQLYQEYASGTKDSEPDLFYYSLPDGTSGTFVFDFADSVRLKEMKNIKITYTRDGSNLINAFRVTDSKGNIYEFTSMDKTKAVIIDGPPTTDPNFYATSWYITKMVNHNHTDSVVYEYAQDQYTIANQAPRTEFFYSDLEPDVYSELKYQTSRISKIIFSSGSVEFIASTAYRKDVYCCAPYLDKIVVKNYKGDILKTVRLNHSYFAPDRNYTLTETVPTEGVRLKLDSVTTYSSGANPTAGLVTRFEYFEDYRLPARNSKSADHWGYFNGKPNTKLEPKRLVKVKFLEAPWTVYEFGSADRSSSFAQAKSYLLKKIIYPTGGSSEFTFESNTVNSSKLDVKVPMASFVSNTSPSEMTKTAIVTTITSPKTKLSLRCMIPDPDPTIAPGVIVFRVTITNQATSTVVYTQEYFSLTEPGSQATRTMLLDAGTYTIQLQVVNNPNGMVGSFPYTYDNEAPCNNCVVGGVRLKTIANSNGAGQVLKKYYSYDDTIGISSGAIENVPEYGYYVVQDNGIPVSYVRTLSTTYPLTVTQGNVVGYGKVTEYLDSAFTTGKTDYFFTTAREYPDNARGHFYFACDDSTVWDGVVMKKFPAPTIDSRDFVRGLLTKRIDYRKISAGTFSKVREVTNIYDILKYNTCQSEHPIDEEYIKQYTQLATPFKGSMNPGYYIRFYEIYGGYAMLKETQEKSYENGGDITVTTKTDYGRNGNGFINFFAPKKIEVFSSKNENIVTLFKYPADLAGTSIYDQMLGRHILTEMVEQEQLNQTISAPLSKAKMEYALFQSNTVLALQTVKTAVGGNTLLNSEVVEAYDNFGNIRQMRGRDSVVISFVWGYKSNFPVAKIVGATYSSFSSMFSQTVLDNPLTTDAQLRSELNNIRTGLASAKAFVTTYTYSPLVGITSETDPNGRIVYYEYDHFNRLSLVRDNDLNILKKICYNYYGQPETCGVVGFSSAAASGTFTRVCSGDGTGSTVTYTVAAGTYTSFISQADANLQATNDVNANGQAYANANGSCTWTNNVQSASFTRNNCTEGGAGGAVSYTINAGSYSSTVSKADANQLALNAVNAGGQAYANSNANCTWTNQVQSGSFTRNNCGTNGTGAAVTYSIAAGTYSSTTSLAAANLLALSAVNAGGQSYANSNASCTWTSQTQSGNFTRNNCGANYTGSSVPYSVAAGAYSSSVSLADANTQAVTALNTLGQANANTNGTCTLVCNASTCTGEDKKCVNGVCQTGVRVNTDSYYNGTKWVCVYHYEWSDESWSPNYNQLSNFACPY